MNLRSRLRGRQFESLGLVLLLAVVGGCASTQVSSEPQSWCNQVRVDFSAPDWTSLAPDAAKLVRPAALRGALNRLRRSPFVRIGASEAANYAGTTLPEGNHYLVRAGVVGAPGVSVEQYLENAGAHMMVATAWNPRTRTLVVDTFMLAGYFNMRNAAAVVAVPGEVSELRVGCQAAQ